MESEERDRVYRCIIEAARELGYSSMKPAQIKVTLERT